MIAARTSPRAVATATSPTTTPVRTASVRPRLDVRWRVRTVPHSNSAGDQRDRQVDRQQDQRHDVPRDLDEAGREREGRDSVDEPVAPFGEHLGAQLGFGHGIRRIEEEVGLGRRREGVELGHEHERQDDRHAAPRRAAGRAGARSGPSPRPAGASRRGTVLRAGQPQEDVLERIAPPDQLIGIGPGGRAAGD